jgi:hypothetical protein
MKLLRAMSIVLVLIGGLVPFSTLAQQDSETLPVTAGAGRYLPRAQEIGDGWIDIVRGGIAPGQELFQEGVKGVYGGPGGSRAVIYVWITQPDDATAQRAWKTTDDFMTSVQPQWGSVYTPSWSGELAQLSPPAGCANAARADGLDASTRFPVGMTLCAVEPDVIVLTIVSGTYAGQHGYLASDALLAKALAVAGTPQA